MRTDRRRKRDGDETEICVKLVLVVKTYRHIFLFTFGDVRWIKAREMCRKPEE